MHNLENITVKELYSLPEDEFNRYMELERIMQIDGDRVNNRRAKSLGELEYGHVKQIINSLDKVDFDDLVFMFNKIYGLKQTEFLDIDTVSYFLGLKWIKAEILALIKKEKRVLAVAPDPILQMAGVDRLKIFKEGGTLISLARSFSTTVQEVEKWKYSLVFFILSYDTVHADVKKTYSELMKPKTN